MKGKDIKTGEIFNMKYYKTFTRPVKVIQVGNYRAEIQYLDTKTLEPIAVPNPARWGATTEWVLFSSIINQYQEAN
jgi:hypothetical protein